MHENRLENTNFKEFMVDNARANWHAICKVYGNGDPNTHIESQESICLFHKAKCLQRATTKDIKLELQDQYMDLWNKWKNAGIQEEAETCTMSFTVDRNL